MEQLQFWTNISVIWLSFLCFVGAIVPLVMAFYAIRGMNVVLRRSRSYLSIGQSYSGQIRRQVENGSAVITRPVIAVNRNVARVDAAFKQFVRGGNQRRL